METRQKRKFAPIIIVVVVVAAIVVAALAVFLIVPMLQGGETTPIQNTQASSAGSSLEARDTDTVAAGSATATSTNSEPDVGSSSTSNTSTVSDSSARGDSALPDEANVVGDAKARGTANVFLSNFTEVDLEEVDDAASADAKTLIHFALEHDGINSPEFWEDAPDSETMQSGYALAKRESAQRIDELAMRYFGATVDYGAIPAYFTYEGGYVYFNPNDMTQYPQGIACVTGSEALGGNKAKLYFDVFTGSYDATDESLYSGTRDEIMRKVGATQAAYQGSAIVRTNGADDKTGGMTLLSYEINY